MARLFVQIVSGPENPTRAALGLLIAKTAAEEGNEVTVFLAGDGVDYIRPETAEAAQGVGLGSVAEHLAALRAAGAELRLSGLSAKARAIGPEVGDDAKRSTPSDVIALATAADTVLVY